MIKAVFPFTFKHYRVIAIVLFMLGAYGALKMTAATFEIESDFSDTAMLWLGWHHVGWQFFSHWQYTPDNWLFSLVPIHFLLFKCFGLNPDWVFLTGWGLFVANLMLTGMIAHRLHAPLSAYLVPLTLLLVNGYTFQNMALTYSVTHNVTLFYGLLSVIFAMTWIEKQKVIYWGLMAYCMLVASLSDPWFLAVFWYPLLIASLIMMVVRKQQSSRYRALFASLLVLLCIEYIVLHVLRQKVGLSDISLLVNFSVIKYNIIILFHILNHVFNIFPGNIVSASIGAILSLLAMFFLLCSAGYYFYKHSFYREPLLCFCVIFAVFSIVGVCAGFIIYEPTKRDVFARYLMNVLFLFPLCVTVILEKSARIRLCAGVKYMAMIIVSLFIASNILADRAVLQKQPPVLNVQHAANLIAFLNAHHLTEGYGPYWGAYPHAVTFLSQDQIHLLPATFFVENDHSIRLVLGMRPQTSRLWVLPQFNPASKHHFFVLFAQDDETCASMPLCIQGVVAQFGPPKEKLTFQGSPVYVW